MVTVDTADLEKSIDTYVDLLTKALKNSVTQVMYGTANAIVENTPVGDTDTYYKLYLKRFQAEGWDIEEGMLLANWGFHINTDEGYFNKDIRDTQGDLVTNSIREVMAEYKLGDSITASNYTPYALSIENGQSAQAPNGTVKPAEQALLDIYKIQFKDFLNG